MKEIRFNDKDELLGYLINEIEESDDISIVLNYELAKEIANIYSDDDEEYSYFSISMATDTDEYVIGKVSDECFVIEPARRIEGYLENEADKIIILDELINDELLDSLECRELEVISLVEDDCSGEDCGDCCCCNCVDKDDIQEFESYFDLNNKVDEYMELIEDNNKDSKAIRQAFVEFGSWILDNFVEDNNDDNVINQTFNITMPNIDSIEDIKEVMRKLPGIIKPMY